jgi:hypothetical protein
MLLVCCVLVTLLDVCAVVSLVAEDAAVCFSASTAPPVAITATTLTPPIKRKNSRRPSPPEAGTIDAGWLWRAGATAVVKM